MRYEPLGSRIPSAGRRKFERQATHDAEWEALHRRRVRYEAGRYRAVCSCSWVSAEFATRAEAEAVLHPEGER
jgi:hypothetical protein